MVEHAKITSRTTPVTVYLGLLVKTVQQTWTIVQVTCAKMGERAETALTNIHANVRLSSLESFVRLSPWLLIYTHRPPLANSMTASMVYVWTYQALMTISASENFLYLIYMEDSGMLGSFHLENGIRDACTTTDFKDCLKC